MADFIKIDTKYAKRDIQRMNTAAQALEDACGKYNELQAYVEGVYKGDAGKSLAHAIAVEGIRCKRESEHLRIAAQNLRKIVSNYEEYSKKMVDLIKGKK